MKYLLIFISTIAISCGTQIQLVQLNTTNPQLKANHYSQSDSLINISYNFYSLNGNLNFTIQNKSNSPIYIDWKNSSFIVSNDLIIKYWEDEAQISATHYFSEYSGEISGTIKKNDRITFLPPKTEITISKFKLADFAFFELGKDKQMYEETKNWNRSNNKTKIIVKDFTYENTPQKFRNYITISKTEDFKTPIYYDFEFWVSQIQEMNSKQLVGNRISISNLKNPNDPKLHPYKDVSKYFIVEK